MALTAYCKKCAREVDVGETCPYCGSRLGKNSAHAAWCGASTETIHELFDSMTTDACIKILDDAGLRDAVIERIASAVQSAVEHRVGEFVRIGVIIFSNVYGLLAVTTEAQAIIDDWNATGTDASSEANDTE